MRSPRNLQHVLAPIGVFALALAFGNPLAAETRTGRRSAAASSIVSLTIPSVHGVNLPSLPPRPSPSSVAFASRRARHSVETLPLQVISTNVDAASRTVRSLLRPAGEPVGLASRGAARPNETVEVRSSTRDGAFGWTLMNDRIELPSVGLASSGSPPKATVVYEIWQF